MVLFVQVSPPGSHTPEEHPPEAFLTALRARLPEGKDFLPFDAFMDCALYDPQVGYYQQKRQRVAHDGNADFYTASSLGPVYTRLVLAAIEKLSPEPLSQMHFVEFGPESPDGILSYLKDQSFRSTSTQRYGQPLNIPSPAIVFSNELFDAQPFRRFICCPEGWRELGVTIEGNQLQWVQFVPESLPTSLPSEAPLDYLVDWPSGAHALLDKIVASPWQGLFLAFDYGLPRDTILRSRPEGTARSYSDHRMGTGLLHNPGRQDLTCHLVWDEMETILVHAGFEHIYLESQEAFFMHHSRKAIGDIIQSSGSAFSPQKQTLMELLHPDNMGHKFQVLRGHRPAP